MLHALISILGLSERLAAARTKQAQGKRRRLAPPFQRPIRLPSCGTARLPTSYLATPIPPAFSTRLVSTPYTTRMQVLLKSVRGVVQKTSREPRGSDCGFVVRRCCALSWRSGGRLAKAMLKANQSQRCGVGFQAYRNIL